jgi:hypothetical protein
MIRLWLLDVDFLNKIYICSLLMSSSKCEEVDRFDNVVQSLLNMNSDGLFF